MPAKAKPMMVPRRLINHTDSKAAWVTCPASPTPRPTRTPNSTVKCHNSCTTLHAARPTAMLSRPLTTTQRGPQRSMSRPHTGERKAWTRLPTEKADAAPLRLQCNSCTMAWKKTAKENQIPNTTPLVTNACSRTNQAYGAIRWPEVSEEEAPNEASTRLYHGIATTHTERLPGDVAGAV